MELQAVQMLNDCNKNYIYTHYQNNPSSSMQILHAGLHAEFAISPDGDFCPLACKHFLHSGQPEFFALRPFSVQNLHFRNGQILHFSCVQKTHVILINDSY